METARIKDEAAEAVEQWEQAVALVRREGAPQALAECMAQVRDPDLFVRAMDAGEGLETVTLTEGDVGRFLDLCALVNTDAAAVAFWEAYTILSTGHAFGLLAKDCAAFLWDTVAGWRDFPGGWSAWDSTPQIPVAGCPVNFAVSRREARAWEEYRALNYGARIRWIARGRRLLLYHRAGAIVGVLWARMAVAGARLLRGGRAHA